MVFVGIRGLAWTEKVIAKLPRNLVQQIDHDLTFNLISTMNVLVPVRRVVCD